MKAITIHQPYATLIAIGAKHFETRGWRTNFRGSIAIHASKKVDREAIDRLGNAFPDLFQNDEWPTGAVVAICNLVECWKWDAHDGVLLRTKPIIEYDEPGKVVNHLRISEKEQSFGWYGPGRYAWEFTDIQRLPEPIPAKGQQGLWNWNQAQIVKEGQEPMKLPRYMILNGGSPAIHKLGDIRREKDDVIYVRSETQDLFIGNFVEGFGFMDVEFRKSDCRPLTPGEIKKLNNSQIQLGGTRYKMHVDPEGYPLKD